MTENKLQVYRSEVENELKRILGYWSRFTSDAGSGGFFGRIDEDNNADTTAPKGSVLNSRILWTFSAAYNQIRNKEYREIASRAFLYFFEYFIDRDYGGVFWTVDYLGQPLDAKKQVYALAFAIYGLSEYSKFDETGEAIAQAIELFRRLEKSAFDKERAGYIEAFSRDWKALGDLRLSAKDANEKKTMNTHLHILEAYTNLYRVWPDKVLKEKIILLISNFSRHIVNAGTSHLILFFDEDWNKRSATISFGHDIEASWLLYEAAITIGDESLIGKTQELSLKLSTAVLEGLDKDGGLWYEKEGDHLIVEKHWWPQAEAMVGFYNAWELSGDLAFLEHSINSWVFIKNHLLDKKHGEWFWGVNSDYSPMKGQDKVGLWKCPYHNGRACLEIMKRIHQLQK